MFSYHIKASGPLFEKHGIAKQILNSVLEETADWAQNRIKNLTPVRTGRLKAGWVISTSKSAIRVDNPTPYAPFVEKRVGMVSKTVPDVQEKLIANAQKLIKTKLQ
ncbi:HK97 gp10 family phage protein [Calothrix membranacea FACHB-236]|nr:HK97 gp10 family phage protein [Calothrix membranacea FACHB-236]